MLKLSMAMKQVKTNLPVLGTEVVTLPEAGGRVLAEDLFSGEDLPPHPRAAMDGYAVRAEDISTASPQSPALLTVVDTVAAGGYPSRPVKKGEAVTIATGAPMPEGADTVVPVEYTRPVNATQSRFAPVGEKVAVLRSVPKGKNVSPVGEDVRKGEKIASKGQRITPALVGLLAACGFWKVPVVKLPEITILPTGSELVPVTQKPDISQVRNSTAWALAAAVEECGCQVTVLPPVCDDIERLMGILKEVAQKHDMVITCGGVSVGQHDLVRLAWEKLGGKVLFWQVPLRPGKVILSVIWEGKLAIGLSGNPAAALTTFDILLRPILCDWTGKHEAKLVPLKAELAETVKQVKGFWKALRVSLEVASNKLLARPLKGQLSTVLSSLAKSDGYALVPPGSAEVPSGSEVTVLSRALRTFESSEEAFAEKQQVLLERERT